MSLTVETGAGLAGAESYASVADADTRLAGLGMTNWAALQTIEKEQALRRATVYLGQAYGQRFEGQRVSATQALDWPRHGVCLNGFAVASTVVPVQIVQACIDLALKAASGDLAPDLERAVIREKIGPIETEYAANAPQATRYRSIDMALAPFLTGGGAMTRLVRA